ncbi:hypothetical protein GCM10022631_05330 [Deinococcus rubellus]
MLELLNSRVDHPDDQCDHLGWGLEVAGAVDSPAVKLLYDLYPTQIMDGDPIHSIRAYLAAISHSHTAGCPGRHDLGDNPGDSVSASAAGRCSHRLFRLPGPRICAQG